MCLRIFTGFKAVEGLKQRYWKAFQPELGAYQGLARVLKSPSKPQNCRKKEKILEKGTSFYFSAPSSGMHETLIQKRSEDSIAFNRMRGPLRTHVGSDGVQQATWFTWI